MVTSTESAAGAVVRGMRGEDVAQRPWIADKIVEGSLAVYNQEQGILIGIRMADRFGVRAGDGLTLISPKGKRDGLRHDSAGKGLSRCRCF